MSIHNRQIRLDEQLQEVYFVRFFCSDGKIIYCSYTICMHLHYGLKLCRDGHWPSSACRKTNFGTSKTPSPTKSFTKNSQIVGAAFGSPFQFSAKLTQ